jgi:uncharacterized protein with von Willebrand factor type A (vWA) domain
VPTGSVVVFTQALGLVGLDDPDHVYWAGRATLISRPEDITLFDRVFASYWHDVLPSLQITPTWATPVTLAVDEDTDEGDGDQDGDHSGDADTQSLRYSAVEVLKGKDIAGLSSEEWAEAQRLISALRVSTDLRPSRRHRPSRRQRSGHPDLRSTVRRSLPTGGILIRRSWQAPIDRPRRMVFLLDVSGSMEPYARGLARFAHAAVSSRRSGRVEVFTLGTRLTRVTRDLAVRDPDAALRAAAGSVDDWSGGTRIGASLRQFNDQWGVRGLARGAVVVICSDGWDRGDPDLVAAEMARLARVAWKVIWVNPLKASPGYAPLARGMASALPYVDRFVAGHSVSSLEHLAALISGRSGVVA